MNDYDDANGLPYLDDADVKLLYAICERATESSDPPIKALFAAYDALSAESTVESPHDGAIFRYLMRVGDNTRAAKRARRPIDLVQHLKSVLEGLGITVLEPSEHGEDDRISVAADVGYGEDQPGTRARRRLSFDDARLGETWLSEHTESVHPSPVRPAPHGLSKLPQRSSRNAMLGRRARSTSTQREFVSHRHVAASEALQDAYPTETDRNLNPTLYFEPSQTELEHNAEAFLSTSALRSARQVLRTWHETSIRLEGRRNQDREIAIAHDRRILLKQALDQWRKVMMEALEAKRRRERDEQTWSKREKSAVREREKKNVGKAFTHWAVASLDKKIHTGIAHRYMLRFAYFNRWRAIAAENQAKIRSVLCRKYLAVWREKTARRQLWTEQATAHYEEVLMRKCKTRWFWEFCSRNVAGWHEQWVQKRSFGLLAAACQNRQEQEYRADEFRCSRLIRRTLSTLATQLRARQGDFATAIQHHDHTAGSRTLIALRTQTVLAPVARRVEEKIDSNRARKALHVWRQHLNLTYQAAQVDRRRILQTAWMNWNDGLRCTALSQKINERVLVENLYRWVLQERLRLFHRSTESKTLARALARWRAKVDNERDRLADAEIIFAERQRRRRLANGMLQLNITMRAREDAERAAVEFAMSRALPRAVETWKDKTEHARRLSNWAADARFYCLCSSTLKTWKSRTAEHVANRRREAYARVRAMVKIRLVRDCFARLRRASAQSRSMSAEADRRQQERSAQTAAALFERWRERKTELVRLSNQATEIDWRKLQGSALAAIRLRFADFERLDEQAQEFKHETDLALLAGALRRWQWATFTANRKVESADALWARNRDQHIKQMLRHWAVQTVARRSTALQSPENQPDPESPSLRPASRAASRTAVPQFSLLSSPPTHHEQLQSTPGYMRTPSRPRRAGRFRPLRTPAPFTPLAFDSAYLATTPAPLPIDAVPLQTGHADEIAGIEGLTPQITPFSRKLKAGGVASILRRPDLRRSDQDDTSKSVRFAGASRFRISSGLRVKNS